MDRAQRAVSGLHGLKRRHLAYAPPAVSRIDGQLRLAGERSNVACNRILCHRRCDITTRGMAARSLFIPRHHRCWQHATDIRITGLLRYQQPLATSRRLRPAGLALSLCGLVSNMVMLTGWFDSGRGRATGILLMASSLGGALFPLAVGSGIEQLGWRQTVLLTGVGVGSMMLGSAWLLLRDGMRVMPDSPSPDSQRTQGSTSSHFS